MSLPLNILLTNATDIYGGGEFYVLELAKALQERGHHVWVSCQSSNLLKAKCEEANIRVIPIDFPPRGKLLKNILLLKNIIHQYHIHIVHTNSNYDRTAGAFAARFGGAAHVTNVHSFHSIQHNPTQWLRNRSATDHFIVDGYCVKDLLIKDDGIPESKITVVHLGVDPEFIKRNETKRCSVRKEFGFSDTNIVIGNVGRLVPMKGQEYLLKSFGKIVSKYPDARLLLVGDGELRNDLILLVNELHIDHTVIFAGFRDDLQAVYSAFDIYAHSSVEGGGETFPYAVLQALAQELPVVVTRTGDVPAMVEEGANGFVVPDRDPDMLAAHLLHLFKDSSLRRSMASKSREMFLQQFTKEKMVENIERVYHSVLQ